MKLYFCHSRHIDLENELYKPLRGSSINEKHEIIFPHENGDVGNTKDIIRSADIVFAEVSAAATGVGIEVGWADALGVPVVCIYKKGSTPSASLKYVTDDFIEYADGDDMLAKIEDFLSKIV
jgi:nucleoside 2-deoxyribosyltransferase